SSDDTVTAQKSFFTSADNWLVPMPLAFTKPTSACERLVSIVTNPLLPPETYHSSSSVSETNGGRSSARNRAVGRQSRHFTREPCCSGIDSGNPGVKYGRSASGRRMLSLICSVEYVRCTTFIAGRTSGRRNISAPASIWIILTGSSVISNG